MTEKEPSEFAKREEDVLAFWNEQKIFEKSVEREPSQGDFTFYDGPPFATGLPHYGHLLQSAVKDAVPRYKTMQGYRVERQWGWDCHGLPIENIVEKELGTKSKKDIEVMGVKKFNDLCREKIFAFAQEWERIIPRFGRWADMQNAYKTMDTTYMESEWWAFKQLYEKGLIYESYRSMHVCPRCETTLSQGEVSEGYKDIKDLSATVKFELVDEPGTYLLAWTTTPWTLPGNVALAVGADIEYVKLLALEAYAHVGEKGGTDNSEYYILAKEQWEKVIRDITSKQYTVLESFRGSELVGKKYKPLFDYYAQNTGLNGRENGWKVYVADFVTTDTGTGIVHIAPAYGADDMALGKEHNLPFVQHVGIDGVFKKETDSFAGLDLKPRAKDKPEEIREADLTIVRALGEKVFSTEKYVHSYPHCWRCDTALLNYATSSWFVAVEKIKDTLLATAEGITWSPAHIKEGRFGQWLSGARDWSISRQRFWANTIPVWRCDACKQEVVVGSIADLKEKSSVEVVDLHKDVVDEVVWSCECGGTMHRVPDVLDTWFDSGSVPFAVTGNFKVADFIGEAQDQTRAWFYYQHVLAGALFNSRAFSSCIVTGIVLAEDGKKMSKKLKNYPDPMYMIDTYGADAMRLYMLGSPVVQTESLRFSETEVGDIARKTLGRLVNVYEFYELYKPEIQDSGFKIQNVSHVLDQWMVARVYEVHKKITDAMGAYKLDDAVHELHPLIDDLSTWYLRRSRDRIKEGNADALATLAWVLRETAKMFAPFAPFHAEWLWQRVKHTDDAESVHLSAWSATSDFKNDILASMSLARSFVVIGLRERMSADIKVRQPLQSFSIAHDFVEPPFWDDVKTIVADELNVKDVILAPGIKNSNGASWLLDTTITPELKVEGNARDVVRAIQDARKRAGLTPEKTVSVRVSGPQEYEIAMRMWEAHVQKQTNTTAWSYESGDAFSVEIL